MAGDDDVTIRITANNNTGPGIAGARRGINQLRDDMGRFTSGGASPASAAMGKLAASMLTFAPAALPVAASLAPIALNAAGAGVAVAAFGAAVIPQIKTLTAAAEAEGAYNDAVAQHGKGSKEAIGAEQAMQAQMAKMPPATREAAASFSVLKDSFGAWSDSLSGSTMPVFTDSFAALTALFPKFTPLVEGASVQLHRLVDLGAGGVARMGDGFNEFAEGALKKTVDGIVHLSREASSFDDGGAFRTFMDYAKENGPLVADTFTNLGEASINLLEAASGTGVGLLQLANALANIVNAVPPEVLGTFIQLYTTFKLINLAGAGFAATAAAAGRLRGALQGLAATSVAAGGGAAGLRAAFASLSTGAKFGVIAGGAVLLAMAVNKINDSFRPAPPNVEKLTRSLVRFGEGGKMAGEGARLFGKDADGLAKAIHAVANPSVIQGIDAFMDKFTGGAWAAMDQDFDDLKESVKGVDEGMANLVKGGNADQAAAAAARISKQLKAAGFSTEEINAALPKYKEALADAAFEQELAAEAMGIYGDQALRTQAKLDAQKGSVEGLQAAIIALNDTNRDAFDAETQFEAAIDDLAASFKKYGNTLDANTDSGRQNRDSMSQAAAAHDQMVSAGIAAGDSLESMTGKSDRLRKQMVGLAEDTGMSNAEAQAYVNTLLGTPGEIETLVKLEREEAISGLQSVQDAIRVTPGAKSVKVKTLNAAAIKALESVGLKTRRLPDGRTEVYTKNGQSLGSIDSVSRALSNLNGDTATTYVTTVLTRHYRTIGDFRAAHGRATGGPVGQYAHAQEGGPRGNQVLVGEQGPELVDLAPGSMVHTAGATRRIMQQGGGGSASGRPIQVNLILDGRVVARQLIDPLQYEIGTLGGNVQRVLGQRGR